MKNALNWLKISISKIKSHDLEIRRHETEILEILLEIEVQKAYAELKYDGLFSFCIKELKWSESQAWSRIQAMHAMRVVPEVKAMIDEGKMSVTTVAQVQQYLRQDQVNGGVKLKPAEKLGVFESFQNKTSKEVKCRIAELRGEKIKVKLTLELDEETEELWRQAKSLSAHSNQGSDLLCFKILLKNYITTKTKERALKKNQKQRLQRTSSGLTQVRIVTKLAKSESIFLDSALDNALDLEMGEKIIKEKRDVTFLPSKNKLGVKTEDQISTPSRISGGGEASTSKKLPAINSSAYLPIQTRRTVLARDQYQCKNCGSRHALQIDHIHPKAMGGSDDPTNLRTLCRNCNLHKAAKDFGKESTLRI